MIRRLSFGQYAYKKSFVHKLDPRLKLVCVLALSILVFVIRDFSDILIFSFFIVMVILLSRLDIGNLARNLRPFFLMFAFIFAMYAIFSRNQLQQGLIAIWRFLMLITISAVLTFTTTISSLITAIERLTKPLKILGVKPRNVAVMISAAIRFVPVMFLNLERLKEAMLARLADFRKLRYIKLVTIVLLERMLKSASNLSDAMQSRLYNENAESSKALKLGKYGYIAVVFVLIIVLIIY